MKNIKRHHDNLQSEVDGAHLYEALAKPEPDPKLDERGCALLDRAGTTIFIGSGVCYSGGRQLAMGWLAASVAFGIGHLFKVSVSG